MYDVLTRAGIEANDAKAVIYDLILASENGVYVPKKPVYAEKQVVKQPVQHTVQIEEETAVEEDTQEDTARIRRPTRRVSFDAFGGAGEKLR